MSDRLTDLVQALCAAPASESPDAVLRRAGFTPAEVAQLCGRPDAAKQLLTGAMVAFLVPALPGVLRNVARRAAEGDKAAESMVLELVGDKSPLKEKLGTDLTHASSEALLQMARQYRESLEAFVREG